MQSKEKNIKLTDKPTARFRALFSRTVREGGGHRARKDYQS